MIAPQATDGTRHLQLSDAQFRDVEAALLRLQDRAKCRALALIDSSGLLIARCGAVNQKALLLLATLAAANYAATVQMARLLGEKGGFKVHFHEGATNNIYIAGVNKDYSLVTVFNSSTTLGLVRVLAAKTARELDEIVNREIGTETFTRAFESVKKNVSTPEFQDELSARLDALLRAPSRAG